jgi:maltose O-acetyltransferase
MIMVRNKPKLILVYRVVNKVLGSIEYIRNYVKIQIVAARFKSCGEDVIIDYNVWFNNPGNISVGNDCYIGQNVFINAIGDITIGDSCAIAASCKLISGNHGIANNGVMINHQEYSIDEIVIKEDVWLGYNVVVLAGSVIGKGCVVAAGSVVSGCFDEFSIIGGIPARKIGVRT